MCLTLFITSCSQDSKIITIDTHDDINIINFTDSLNYSMNTDTQVNLPKMEQEGLMLHGLLYTQVKEVLMKKAMKQLRITQYQNLMLFIDWLMNMHLIKLSLHFHLMM